MKEKAKAISVLGLVTILCLVAGCDGGSCDSDIHISAIETPSSILHFHLRYNGHPDNIANLQLGAVSDSGRIYDRTDVDGCTCSYPSSVYPSMPDLSGATLSIDLHNQWGHGLFGWSWDNEVNVLSVLEFTFPEAIGPDPSRIDWWVTPHYICSYEISEGCEDHPEPEIWIDYVVLEDPLGQYDLMQTPEDVLSALWQDPLLTIGPRLWGESNGTVRELYNEWSGTMTVQPNREAKLFVGVGVWLRTFQECDRITIGGNSLPWSVVSSPPDRCTLDFGTASYYIMGTVGIDE